MDENEIEVQPTPAPAVSVMDVDLAEAVLREYAERPPVNDGERYWVRKAQSVLVKAKKG